MWGFGSIVIFGWLSTSKNLQFPKYFAFFCSLTILTVILQSWFQLFSINVLSKFWYCNQWILEDIAI